MLCFSSLFCTFFMSDNTVKPEKIQSVRGMHDLLPEDHDFFTVIKKALRHRCRQAGFRRISTPILEESALFERGLGDADAAGKEMYRLQVGDHNLALKPEGTAGVCRAYIEHGMASLSQPVQLYYIDPHFRHDRPQKGRYRQFYQCGVELLGGRDPSLDAQLILLSSKILKDLEIDDRFELQINTIGTMECRKKYESALTDYFLPKDRHLCSDCQKRVSENPLRILDCKEEDCKILSSLAPQFKDYLDEESKDYYTKVKTYLDAVEISYTENPLLVRGLDYYCDTVFEFVDEDGLTVCGGGRYDGLVEMLGGQHTPSFGFSMGVERLIAHIKDAGVVPPEKDETHVYVACLGDLAKAKAMKLLGDLHDRGIHAIGAIGKASMKTQLQRANKTGAPWTLLLGEIEVRENMIILKNMKEGMQERLPLEGIVDHVKNLMDPEKLDSWRMGE